ncbi:HPr family phosphocarrier protein [Lacrimispora algidixylanolytica]|uniref:PTS galactitol transporter subunit IIC n=1 Tax=Lacrimispora algidixylanolytica TaxID=94868 RepID=A0A419SYQ1_9FIRM|nr:HPr family phosphocarrier protein [Lacrimispora algidixylanolytica]RKD30392.1 PTS galactitol transporter subunit IIC [Lacrimispora algidixylanolytica]
MKKFEYIITKPAGIHARPAGMLVKEVSVYESSITIEKNGQTADGKRLMALMSLNVNCKEKVTFIMEGTDEDMVAIKLETFCKENL